MNNDSLKRGGLGKGGGGVEVWLKVGVVRGHGVLELPGSLAVVFGLYW